MHVVFIEPAFPRNQREFVRGLKAAGASVIGLGERPPEALDPDLASWMVHYERVPNVCDTAAMADRVRRLQSVRPIERLEATVEAHILPAAQVREACGIPGTTTRTAWLCRDKPSMKDALRDAGVPCAASIGSDSVEELRAFAERTGFPLVVKPRSGAGAAGAERVDDATELDAALARAGVGAGRSVAVEEFLEGHEGFYDTLCVGGQVVHDFATHYFPNVLEAMRTRWISPQFITTNRIEGGDGYDEVRELGRRVNDALGIHTSATHMEWFFGPKGLKFSEIGCRPPGVGCWDLYCSANDLDLYREWAEAVIHGRPRGQASRRYSAGIIALRPDRDGLIAGYDGLETIQREYGGWILDVHLPPEGTPTQPPDAGYMANAWIRMRHPDYDELRTMLDRVGKVVQVRAH